MISPPQCVGNPDADTKEEIEKGMSSVRDEKATKNIVSKETDPSAGVTNKKSLPKIQWSVDEIDYKVLKEIYDRLDISGRSEGDLFAALDCFSLKEVELMKMECRSTGGQGLAKLAIGKWCARSEDNSVGAFKTIVLQHLKRKDVFDLITKWEEN
ncbi:uncharacterized protein LOC124442669 isoform X2 [Xenia sp. Carnegie-2017]|uniref:uncharacterized protein LOC124442669 isoform X2 n=1 Tax=Xenia sp. Carnegie-2017 TaxID=2897299 RepID=UPI001F04312D|nr:uncharacterized protein LOC124442669 isoform X2 [Xenia sp. Carnegie-2017]